MDPITAAVATGADAAVSSVAALAVKDLYGQLKAAIRARHPQASASLDAVEAQPNSQVLQESLAEVLAGAEARSDTDLLQLARALIDAIEREAPDSAAAVGVDLGRVKAEFLNIERISGSVRIQNVETVGGISISDIRAEGKDSPKY